MPSIRPFNGKMPQIGPDVWIDPSAVIIGDVEIGSQSSIWPTTVIRGDVNFIRIGTRTNIQDASVLHVTHASSYNEGGYPLTIGNNVTVGHKVMLHGCEVGDHCLIGMCAVVMDAVVIEPQVILAAGSLVPPGKRLTSGYLWQGTPARRTRELTEQELDYFDYLAGNYARLGEQYRSAN